MEQLMSQILTELSRRAIPADVMTVHKNNIDTQILTIRPENSCVAPAFSEDLLQSIAEPGMNIEEITNKLLAFVDEHKAPDFDFQNADYILDHVRLAVCSENWNGTGMLSDTPHEVIPSTDLAVYAKIYDGDYSCRVTNQLLAICGLSVEDVFEAARANNEKSGYEIKTIWEALQMPELPGPTMLMCRTNDFVNGAAVLADLSAMDKVAERLGAEYITVIPSSIWEILVTTMQDFEHLATVIQEVNQMVNETERLSDHAYLYKKGRGYIAERSDLQHEAC